MALIGWYCKMSYRPYASLISEAQSGIGATVQTQISNQSGQTIPILYGVSLDSNGRAKATDVSVEQDAFGFVGISMAAIADNSNGDILIGGKLENITTVLNRQC